MYYGSRVMKQNVYSTPQLFSHGGQPLDRVIPHHPFLASEN